MASGLALSSGVGRARGAGENHRPQTRRGRLQLRPWDTGPLLQLYSDSSLSTHSHQPLEVLEVFMDAVDSYTHTHKWTHTDAFAVISARNLKTDALEGGECLLRF